jgi:hypothetical protein
MKSVSLIIVLVLACVAGLVSYGQNRLEPLRPQVVSDDVVAQKSMPVYGPYQAIAINRGIIRDVRVDKELNIFLQLVPEHKNKELVVKISSERFAEYRNWVYGGLELVSPVNAGKTSFGWTDRVQTKAKYIEYWMDGSIFLHLKRMDL